jgi:hypothetical protein
MQYDFVVAAVDWSVDIEVGVMQPISNIPLMVKIILSLQ